MAKELPISVIVPHIYSREKFFTEQCLPSILKNRPREIIVLPNDGSLGSPAAARNDGINSASQQYVMLVDDDTILYPNALETLLVALENQSAGVGFAYCDFKVRVHPGVVSNFRDGWTVKARDWDFPSFMKANYVSNMSLIKKEAEPLCDESLKRLIDWDMFIAMASAGWKGAHCPEVLFEAHQIDKSVSMAVTDDEAIKALRAKWGSLG